MTTAIASTISQITSNMFDKLDKKSQGYIDKAELTTAFKDAGVEGMDVETIDGDKDGKITKSEMTAGVENLVAQLESSALSTITGSSSTSDASSTSNESDVASAISSEAASQEASASPPAKTESPVPGATKTENYTAADTNKDGEVSVKEAVAYAAAQEAKTEVTKAANAKEEQTNPYNVAQAMQAYAYDAATTQNQVSVSA